MIGTLSNVRDLHISPKAAWKLELSNGLAIYGNTKAEVVHKGVELYELDKVYENMSTRNPQTYLKGN